MARKLKILVTGADGMVGNAVRRYAANPDRLADSIVHSNFPDKEIELEFIFRNRRQLDLTDREGTFFVIKEDKPDIIIHLAAKVGGLFANQKDNENFYLKNLHMSENLLAACYKYGVNHTFTFLSTCIYPQNPALLPYKTKDLHNGEPHPSNYGYAFAKRQHEVMCRFYNEKDGNHVCLVPNNLYGPNDNFNLETAHVIPALIRKMHDAWKKDETLIIPGSGMAKRQFTFSDDIVTQTMAYILHYLGTTNEDEKDKIINIGSSFEYSISDLAVDMVSIFGRFGIHPNYEFAKETYNPVYDGIFSKPSDLTRINTLMRTLRDDEHIVKVGLKASIDWYLKNEAKR